ncbi:oligosaccharide flippase family protein [Holdemania sp. 1001302B_160321_E10]|uniref:oligosaccharide flippase family protein n=1 Tax=Holdemania sp. 1001302B_160321_E10 TaxID=2787120 RepID=UPI00189A5B56|nr:oligosaccharide flippase family protein [Holdemania sp. 1001302B_160321_E10]
MEEKQVKLGAILSYINNFISIGISILYTPIMLQLLGQSDYGVYNIASSVISYLGLLSFGLGGAYSRFYFKKRKDGNNKIAELNGLYFLIFLIISIVVFASGVYISKNVNIIFGSKLIDDEAIKLSNSILILTVCLACTFSTTVFDSYIMVNRKFVWQQVLKMISVVLNPMITLPLLLMGFRIYSILFGTVVITVITTLTNIVLSFRLLGFKLSFKNFDFKLLYEMFIFTFFLFLNSIIDQVNWNVDKFLLTRIKGVAAVAIYSISSQINTYYLSFSTAISNMYIPEINQQIIENNNLDNVNKIFFKVGRLQMMVLGLIISGFIFFGKPFITLWVGQSYIPAYYAALWLMVPVTLPLIQNIGIEILKAMNKHKFRSILYTIMAIINILISIPLCYKYGVVGCAIGTGLVLLVANGLLMNIYYYKVGLDIIKFWYNIIKMLRFMIIPLLVGGLITLISCDSFTLLIFLILIYTFIYLLSLFIYELDDDERKFIIHKVNILKLFRH